MICTASDFQSMEQCSKSQLHVDRAEYDAQSLIKLCTHPSAVGNRHHRNCPIAIAFHKVRNTLKGNLSGYNEGVQNCVLGGK